MTCSPRSLYVHIPYCESKCFYCAFNSRAGWTHAQAETYLKALTLELTGLAGGDSLELDTVYIGGGTPTALEPEQLSMVLEAISERAAGGRVSEWTVEANPGTVTSEKLRVLTSGHVTRVSMGVQTFDRERRLPPQVQANIDAKYHLNEPLWNQYLLYLKGLIKGDLGPSYKYLNRTVSDIIASTLPVSALLGILALAFAVTISLPTGLLAAYFHNSWVDRWST